ncbi:MAG: hypothetical protein KI791_14370 [Cyclobacteriaceae bacterium]|nr:hypothetical protein [Cyclobacteriaceae bacterium SS2]
MGRRTNRLLVFLVYIICLHTYAQVRPIGNSLKLIWSQSVQNNSYESSSRPLITEEGVFLTDIQDYFFNISTGEIMKDFKEVNDSTFLIFDSRDRITVYNTLDGTVSFTINRARGPYLGIHSPYFTNDSLMVIVSSPKRKYKIDIYNLNAQKSVWERAIESAIVSRPIFYRDLLICTTTSGIEFYDRRNGYPIKTIHTNNSILDSKIEGQRLIYWSEGLHSYDLENHELEWTSVMTDPEVSSIQLLTNGLEALFINDYIFQLDLVTGRRLWKSKSKVQLKQNNLFIIDSLLIGYEILENTEIITGIHIRDGTKMYQGFTSESHLPDYNHPTNRNILDRQKFYFSTLSENKLVVGRSFSSIILLKGNL